MPAPFTLDDDLKIARLYAPGKPVTAAQVAAAFPDRIAENPLAIRNRWGVISTRVRLGADGEISIDAPRSGGQCFAVHRGFPRPVPYEKRVIDWAKANLRHSLEARAILAHAIDFAARRGSASES